MFLISLKAGGTALNLTVPIRSSTMIPGGTLRSKRQATIARIA